MHNFKKNTNNSLNNNNYNINDNNNFFPQENTSLESTQTLDTEVSEPRHILKSTQERGRKKEHVVLKGQTLGEGVDIEKASERPIERSPSEEAKLRRHLPHGDRTLTPTRRVTQQGVSHGCFVLLRLILTSFRV